MKKEKSIFALREYYSQYFFLAAKSFTERLKEIEENAFTTPELNLLHITYATNSILSTVAFLEAAINEFYQDIYDDHREYVGELDKRVVSKIVKKWKETELGKKRIKLLEKYQFALEVFERDKFNKGKGIYQNVDLVIDLRNILTHYKPTTRNIDDTIHIENKLRSKFQENRLLKDTQLPFFPKKCLGFGCSNWAFNSCKKFTDEFAERMKIKMNYQTLEKTRNTPTLNIFIKPS